MAENEFIFKINGKGVSPESVDVSDLAAALVLLRRSIAAAAKSVEGASENFHLSLVRIAEGSDSLTLNASAGTIEATRRVTRAVANRQPRALPPDAVTALYRLSEFIEWNEWESCSFESNGSKISDAKILAGDELFVESPTYSGQSVIYGQCLRVGGDKKMSAFMRLIDGSRRAVRLTSQEIAQQLGQRLYQTVGLSGKARWRTDNSELVAFVADSILPYSDRDRPGVAPRTMTEAFTNLAAAAGTRWQDVDPEEFVLEQRRD